MSSNDLKAQQHFKFGDLFIDIIDFNISFRSFNNVSEYRNSFITHCINQCNKYLVIPSEFETRWIIALYQVIKIFKNDFKGIMFFLIISNRNIK